MVNPPSQELWARVLVPNNYPEGMLNVGDIFRPGWTKDGSQLLQYPYANARLGYFTSRGLAVEVAAPADTHHTPHAHGDIGALKDARAMLAAKQQPVTPSKELPDNAVHSSVRQVDAPIERPEGPPKD